MEDKVYSWKPIKSFAEGINRLQQLNEFEDLKRTLKESFSLIPITNIEEAKVQVAIVLQKKYEEEWKASQDKPMTRSMVDKKYQDLAQTLRSFVGPPSKTPPSPPIARTNKPPVKSTKAQVPARVNNGLSGLAATLFNNWLSAKKRPLIQLGLTGGTLAACIWLYNKFKKPSVVKKEEPEIEVLEPVSKKKNPEKTEKREKDLRDFERTFKALERIKQFTLMSRNKGSELSGSDYSKFLTQDKIVKSEDPQKVEAKRRQSRLDVASNQLLKEMDSIANTLREVPKSKEPLKFLTKKEDLALPPPEDILNFPEKERESKPKKVEPKSKTSVPTAQTPIIVKSAKRKKKNRLTRPTSKVVEENLENSKKSNENLEFLGKIEVGKDITKTFTPITKFSKKIPKI